MHLRKCDDIPTDLTCSEIFMSIVSMLMQTFSFTSLSFYDCSLKHEIAFTILRLFSNIPMSKKQMMEIPNILRDLHKFAPVGIYGSYYRQQSLNRGGRLRQIEQHTQEIVRENVTCYLAHERPLVKYCTQHVCIVSLLLLNISKYSPSRDKIVLTAITRKRAYRQQR